MLPSSHSPWRRPQQAQACLPVPRCIEVSVFQYPKTASRGRPAKSAGGCLLKKARVFYRSYEVVPLRSSSCQVYTVHRRLKWRCFRRSVACELCGSIPRLLLDYGQQNTGSTGHGHMLQCAAQVEASMNSTQEEVVMTSFSRNHMICGSDSTHLNDKQADLERDLENNSVRSYLSTTFESELQEPIVAGAHLEDREERGSLLRLQGATWKSVSQQANSILEFSTGATNVADQAEPRLRHFWQIVQNDMSFISRTLNWTKEVALPSFAENVEKVVTLRVWEDNLISLELQLAPIRDSYPELRGWELIDADARVLKGYFYNALAWLSVWRIPLEPYYDTNKIAAYFNSRPHVLLFRIFQVAAVFGLMIAQLEIDKTFSSGVKISLDDEAHVRTRGAELLKGALVKLGPTFIKVGQSLATRPDLVGADVAKILGELHDNLPPFSTQQAYSIIENELAQPLNNIFESLSELPVAAASFGQVYKGRTVDGIDVAVKVQRPNLLHAIALDIYILRIGLAAIREIMKRRSDLTLYADELGQGLFGELDYIQEAANALEFKVAHAKLSFLGVPNIFTSLSTKRVLTMEWVNGDSPAQLLLTAEGRRDQCTREQTLKAKQRLFSLVNKGVEASLVQLFDTGILHADPHPGNLLYTQEGKMVFLDFGLLCRMEKRHQMSMIASVAHIVNADWKNFVHDLANMDILPPDINSRSIALELEDALGDAVPQEGVPDIKFSKVLARVLAVALKHQFKMPPYFVLVLRSIASLEGLALAADPDFKVFAASYPFVLQKLLTDNSAPLRRILITLVLNEKKQFRWDRLASFATLARQHTMKRAALETGLELQNVEVLDYDSNNLNPELVPMLVNLLLSENGSIIRQLVLEADTLDLAQVFNSRRAAAFRRHLVTLLANVLYKYGTGFLKKQTILDIEESNPMLPLSLDPSKQVNFTSDKALADEMKSLINSPTTLDFSVLHNRQLHFLLQTGFSRLKRNPLLMLLTGWTCLKLLCYSTAIAAHRIIVVVCLGASKPLSAAVRKPRLQRTPA